MAAAAILDFGKFAFLAIGVDIGWCQVYPVKIWRELLRICGNYKAFSKFKMAAAAILDFHKFHFSLNCSMRTTSLRKTVKFGDDQFAHSTIA